VIGYGHLAVTGGTASEELKSPAGSGIISYFGIWLDELRKTHEEPDSFLLTVFSATQTGVTCRRALWNVRLVACFGVC